MNLNALLPILQGTPVYKKFNKVFKEKGEAAVSIASQGRSFFISALRKHADSSILLIAPSAERARRLVSDINAFSITATLIPDIETMPYDSLSPSAASVGRRFAVLHRMQVDRTTIWVSPVQTLLRVLPPKAENLDTPIELHTGENIDTGRLLSDLGEKGYVRVPMVEDNGQFSVRGGIIDVFLSHADNPVRIEFFGDEVESIRVFDEITQRSIESINDILIFGCRQLLLSEEVVERIMPTIPATSSEWLQEEAGKIKDHIYFEGVDKYMPFFYSSGSSLFDYLPEDLITIFDEPEEVEQTAIRYYDQQQEYVEHLESNGALLATPRPYFLKPDILNVKKARIDLTSIGRTKESDVKFAVSPITPFSGHLEDLSETIENYRRSKYRIVIALADEKQTDRVQHVLQRYSIPYSMDKLISDSGATLAIGDIRSGFTNLDTHIALFSAQDLFGRQLSRKQPKVIHKGRPISSLAELAIGDYVVHSSHGIAVYGGLQRREVANVVRDYAVLEYAHSDKLFVPVDQLDRITRYIGSAGEVPVVNRLGGTEWARAKRKARASVRKAAFDLLSLYASRAKVKGFAFSADTPWQKELEENFVYDETPDQLSSIDEIKHDMEQDTPMDRLICGDVGYGKTEVAIRAAFKAVMDGKQVMVLVPTTILAQQHYTTFSERLEPFPVTLEMVSRFKSQIQQKDIIERFNNGKVDILIGTHRLLSKDVHPLDLGLVIIDEEQRFGVNDKEKFREFKKSIDVMSMSATPIPRTLQMSLSGVRDMSVIETPPEGRHPIVTQVGKFDDDIMVQAIRRELGRGGQVYYVHNRVESIDRVAERVMKLVPEARVAVAHGQMSEHQLERIMVAFLDKEYDVLVCTTIIESGIDIPNVNTLIVDNAELLGLAQLYQLRGRVGRTRERAFAYFFYSPQRFLTQQAFERLKTISDFTELGSGIKIALKDLEIRGAGSLLGAEQHGNMVSVGFELYCQMLREAIEVLEGKPVVEHREVKIDIPVSAYIPESYIAEESMRIEAYKKIVSMQNGDQIPDIVVELTDRYGHIPEPVRQLLDIVGIRLKAIEAGITEINYQNGKLKLLPISASVQRELIQRERYTNIVYRPERQYILVSRIYPGEIIAFLKGLIDVIIENVSVKT